MILVFDIGTTVLKGGLLTDCGSLKSVASKALALGAVGEKGCFEAEPAEWIESFKAVSAELLNGFDVLSLRAVVISGNGPTLVPVAKDGSFLKPVMSWLDRRGTAESKKTGIIQGFVIDPTFYLPKAMWIASNRPDVYEKTETFLSCPEAMAFWLTGESVTILPGQKFEKYFWNDELLEKTGMDKSKFPDFKKPGHITGTISTKGANESGLPAGIPVVSAGPDFIVSQLGTASVYPGRACDRAGTSEGINLCTDKYIEDPRLMGYGHIVEPWYNVSGIISTSGKSVEWIRRQLGGEMLSYKDFLAGAADSSAGAEGLIFLPYLAGERAPHWDPSLRASFIGLGLYHGPSEIKRAVLEATGYAMRDVMDVMAGNDAHVDELRITGAPSKSRLWNQIKADITGRRLLVPESSESELIGDFIIGLKALGDTDSLAETADKTVRIKEVFEPDQDNHRLYSEYFEVYRESYKNLRDVFVSLKQISSS